MKISTLCLGLCPLLLATSTYAAVTCVPADDNACAVSSLSVTVNNTPALYYGNDNPITGTPPDETIHFGTLPLHMTAPVVANFDVTLGTFNPDGGVTLSMADNEGSSGFGFAMKNPVSGNLIGFEIQYHDCNDPNSSFLHDIPYNTPISLNASQSSMVAINYPTGTAPCHPYQLSATPGNGAGQLIFTIPAGADDSAAGGDYSDNVTLTVNAL